MFQKFYILEVLLMADRAELPKLRRFKFFRQGGAQNNYLTVKLKSAIPLSS